MEKENVVGNLWEISKFKLHKSLEMLIKSRFSGIKVQDEARHGKGFEGLLNRYFK